MLDFLYKALMVVLAIGALVFVHELGHFLVAKLVGVRVERFILGFGPLITSFRSCRSGTQYGVAWIPLGGYVMMAGQHDFDRPRISGAPDEYTSKSVPARLAIILAGVTMNAIFGLLVLVAAFRVGVPYTVPEVGPCATGEPAYKTGFREGDRLLAVNGRPMRSFHGVLTQVALAGVGEPLVVRLKRGDEELTLAVTPKPSGDENLPLATLDINPPVRKVLFPIGAKRSDSRHRTFILGVYDDTAAAEAGLREGDEVLRAECDGQVWEGSRSRELTELIKQSRGRLIEVSLWRRGAAEPQTVTLRARERGKDKQGQPSYIIGVDLSESILLGEVQPGSPAARAGLQAGDRLVGLSQIDEKKLNFRASWERGEKGQSQILGPAWLVAEPGQDYLALELTLPKREIECYPLFGSARDPLGQPLSAFGRALIETRTMFYEVRSVLTGLLTRRVSPKATGGPIMIIYATAASLEQGFGFYLWLIAFISLNLAVINLLPMPVLDGGHVAFLLYEGVRGRPLSQRVQGWLQFAGLLLLLFIVLVVTKNDVVRFFFS